MHDFLPKDLQAAILFCTFAEHLGTKGSTCNWKLMEKELLTKKAHDGYTICCIENCPQHDHCLRWLVGQHIPSTNSTYRCVNPHFEGVATDRCPLYRSDQKVRFAKGMLHMFNGDMPRRLEPAVRYGIIRKTNRTYYFEYRNGSRLIPPALQEHIRNLFRQNGWTGDVNFDSYVEDYDW